MSLGQCNAKLVLQYFAIIRYLVNLPGFSYRIRHYDGHVVQIFARENRDTDLAKVIRCKTRRYTLYYAIIIYCPMGLIRAANFIGIKLHGRPIIASPIMYVHLEHRGTVKYRILTGVTLRFQMQID